MKLSLDEIKAIEDPEEKLRKLREFELEAKEEIEEAEKLFREEFTDLERQKRLESIQLPETGPVRLEELFGEASAQEAAPIDSEGVQYRVTKDLETLEALSDYQSLDENQREAVAKIEGTVSAFKYLNTSKEVADKLTASKGIIDNLKKYVLG